MIISIGCDARKAVRRAVLPRAIRDLRFFPDHVPPRPLARTLKDCRRDAAAERNKAGLMSEG